MRPITISRENARHYVWGENCDGWRLLQSASLSVIEEHMPPGASEVRHFHRRAQQFFFILSGEAMMETEGGASCWQADRAFPFSQAASISSAITPRRRSVFW
jgi:mannose-6-phosphate isomerase-like protein (cupin superfamily)